MDTRLLIAYASELMGVIAITMLLALTPRLKPLPIAFRNPRREALISIALFALSFVLIVLLPRVPGLNTAQSYGLIPAEDLNRGMRDALLHRFLITWVCLIPFGAVLAYCDRCTPFASVGLNGRDLRPAIQLGLGLGLVALFLSGKIFTLIRGFQLEDLYTLFVWIGLGLSEEIIFRGYLQPRLSAVFNPTLGWLAAAALYTIWLMPAFLGRPDFLLQMIAVAARGLVLGWIMQKTGHVVAPGLYRAISGWIQFI